MLAGARARLDIAEVIDGAGEGPVLGRQVEVAEAEGDAHRVEAQQLRAVHLRCHARMQASELGRHQQHGGYPAWEPQRLCAVHPAPQSRACSGSCTHAATLPSTHPRPPPPRRQSMPRACIGSQRLPITCVCTARTCALPAHSGWHTKGGSMGCAPWWQNRSAAWCARPRGRP